MEWGTIFSGISAAASVVAAISGTVAAAAAIAVYRYTKGAGERAVSEQDARRWSMDLESLEVEYPGGPRRALVGHIRYDRNGPPIRILTIAAQSPIGLRLNEFTTASTGRSAPDGGGPRPAISLGFDGDAVDTPLYVPPRPLWTYLSRKSSLRLRVSVRFEERDAARRRKQITVKSAAMLWSAIAPEANARKNADGTWAMGDDDP